MVSYRRGRDKDGFLFESAEVVKAQNQKLICPLGKI